MAAVRFAENQGLRKTFIGVPVHTVGLGNAWDLFENSGETAFWPIKRTEQLISNSNVVQKRGRFIVFQGPANVAGQLNQPDSFQTTAREIVILHSSNPGNRSAGHLIKNGPESSMVGAVFRLGEEITKAPVVPTA